MLIIEKWLNSYPLMDIEKEYVNYHNTDSVIMNDNEYPQLVQEYFDRMPYSNVTNKTHTISFDVSATTFIKKLFEHFVDENTLVITSDCEHPNVKDIVSTYSNTLVLNQKKDIRGLKIQKILNEAKKYKKVFVYIIGTQNSNGEITPQIFFEKLKETFDKNSIDNKIVLDDVQGMFLIPRDYSIFDYVIGTAHALVDGFDMGILISKEYFSGFTAYNWGQKYLKSLDTVLKRKQKLHLFRNILIDFFGDYLKYDNVTLSDEFSAPYIFYMRLPNDIEISDEIQQKLHDYYILFPDSTNNKNSKFIHLRAHQFIQHPEYLEEGLQMVLDILQKGMQK